MPKVKMTRGEWDTVVMVLTMARDQEIVAYIDDIIDQIDNQVAEQEY
jgi:hypothetical protein